VDLEALALVRFTSIDDDDAEAGALTVHFFEDDERYESSRSEGQAERRHAGMVRKRSNLPQISAEELDRLFEDDPDEFDKYVIHSSTYRGGDPPQWVSEKLPDTVVASLDEQVARLDTNRSKLVEALVRQWLATVPDATEPFIGAGLPTI
jgi:hypothetical protein